MGPAVKMKRVRRLGLHQYLVLIFFFFLYESLYFLIRHVIVDDFGRTGCFPGVAPVDELLFEQSGFIVLSQSSKHRPVWATLTFPTTQK